MNDPDFPLQALEPELRQLVDSYRARCLWFLRADHYPRSPEEVLRVLQQIEKHGDREGFVRASKMRQWLSRRSSAPSVGS